jgi:hypothetical protein
LNVTVLEQGYSWVQIKITDGNNNLIQDSQIDVFLQDTKISYTNFELSEGVYNISVSFEYINEDLIIVATKTGYFSNSINILLGSLAPLEEQHSSFIPGFSTFIISMCFLGISMFLIIKRYKYTLS